MQNRAKFHYDNCYTPEQSKIGAYIVHQIGDLNCEAGYTVPEHVQQVHEISYVVAGKGIFGANGTEREVKRGSLILVGEGETHKIVSSKDEPLRFMYLGFKAQIPIQNEMIRQLEAFFANPPCRFYEEAFEVQDAFIRLLTETVIEDSFSQTLKEYCVTQLLCQIFRIFSTKKPVGYQIGEGQLMDVQRLVYDVTHYIDANIGSIRSLQQLSAEFGYSYTYISRVFTAHMGQSLHQYYTKCRFEKARKFLQEGMTVTDTAQMVGFWSIHSFSRAYKAYFGYSPRDTAAE